jgi:uncharacterized integral membrane protein
MFRRPAPDLIDPPPAAAPPGPMAPAGGSADLATADAAPQSPAVAQPTPETRRAHAGRMAHRTRLHVYAVAAVVVLVYVVALATTNTHRVRVDWVFAHSTVPLVWLTLFAAILGWLLGILITMLFRMRTRAPRRPGVNASPPA